MQSKIEEERVREIASYIGTMQIASNRNGIAYRDWRKDFVGKRGLIQIHQLVDRPKQYVVYFYLTGGKFMHSSFGDLQIDGKKIELETKNSIYEFEIDPESTPEEFYSMLVANSQSYYWKALEILMASRESTRKSTKGGSEN